MNPLTRFGDWLKTAWERITGNSSTIPRSAAIEFHRQREHIEARFFDQAAASGRPRGLRWVEIDFEDDVLYARQLSTREWIALVAVTVSFEAIEGGPMEEVEAVSRKRAATALFRYVQHAWTSEGRVLFNVSPAQAVEHFHEDLVLAGQPPAA